MSAPRHATSVRVVGSDLIATLECGHFASLPCDSAPPGWRVLGDSIDLRRALLGSWSCVEPGCDLTGDSEPKTAA